MQVLLFWRDTNTWTWKDDIVELDDNDSLHSMYKHIGCDLVELLCVDIEGVEYDLWFDEEFLMKGTIQRLPTLRLENDVMLRGKIIIAKSDDDGKTIGLNDDDFPRVRTWLHERISAMKNYEIKSGIAEQMLGRKSH